MEIREKGEVCGYSLFLADITEQYELMERVREEKERADAAWGIVKAAERRIYTGWYE